MMMELNRSEPEPGQVVYRPEGRLDGETSERFLADILAGETRPPKSLLLNLAGVPFVSSAGLRSVLKLCRWASENQCWFAVSNLQPMVAQVFEITAILPPAQTFGDEEAARKALKG